MKKKLKPDWSKVEWIKTGLKVLETEEYFKHVEKLRKQLHKDLYKKGFKVFK